MCHFVLSAVQSRSTARKHSPQFRKTYSPERKKSLSFILMLRSCKLVVTFWHQFGVNNPNSKLLFSATVIIFVRFPLKYDVSKASRGELLCRFYPRKSDPRWFLWFFGRLAQRLVPQSPGVGV